MARFLYLVQGAGALPPSLDALRGPDSDVIALTWRKPTKTGIFYPFSTFTEGRNRLYAAARERSGDYLYFIMLDEDAELVLSDRMNERGENPWRMFERCLLEYEPAVGVPWYGNWHRRTSAEVDTLFAFDLIVNAIHAEALSVLLPFDDRFDALSWWHMGVEFVHLAALLYPGHTLQFNGLEVRNRSSLPYPRSGNFDVGNTEVAGFIRDPEFRRRFKPHPSAIGDANGEVKRKDRSYCYDDAELGRLFDLDAPFWRRKAEIASALPRSQTDWGPWSLTELGAWLNMQAGPAGTAILLGPLIQGRELVRRGRPRAGLVIRAGIRRALSWLPLPLQRRLRDLRARRQALRARPH